MQIPLSLALSLGLRKLAAGQPVGRPGLGTPQALPRTLRESGKME